MFKLESVEYKNGYLRLPNEIYREEHLDAFSIGVLGCILQCDPKNWNLNPKSIASLLGCGEDSVTKAFKRLEANGHLEREDIRNEKGYKQKSLYTVHPISTNIDYYYKRTGKHLEATDYKLRLNKLKIEEMETKRSMKKAGKNSSKNITA